MKKVKFYIVCFLSLAIVIAFASCEDNADFWGKHTLTDDEIAEIARQDSIKKAQMNSINADLILEYSVDIVISQTLYDGATLAIELDKIANLFEISVENLLAGIAGESGAPEIKGFAIDSTTHVDYGKATNTNAPWGHWWNKDGDVIDYGADAMIFAEFDTETGEFKVGQYPAHLVEGQTIKFIECLKYNEKRVAVVITAHAKGREQITAAVVNTQELSINVIPRGDYTQEPLKFDLARTLSDLGVSSMEGVKFLGVNEDGSYAQETTTPNGFWYDMNGFVGSWGDNASVFTTYGDEDNGFDKDQIGIGQMPDNLEAGQIITIQYGILANNKIEMLKITVKATAYEDPETPPVGNPGIIDREITLTKPWSADYASIEADIKEVLRDAFKMTTYQIHKAITSGDLKVYLNEVTEEAPKYTADAPGYWIDADGKPVSWAEGLVWCSIGHDNTTLYLYGGNHSDNAVAGDIVKTKMIVTCNGGQVNLNITFKLTVE